MKEEYNSKFSQLSPFYLSLPHYFQTTPLRISLGSVEENTFSAIIDRYSYSCICTPAKRTWPAGSAAASQSGRQTGQENNYHADQNVAS